MFTPLSNSRDVVGKKADSDRNMVPSSSAPLSPTRRNSKDSSAMDTGTAMGTQNLNVEFETAFRNESGVGFKTTSP